MSAGVPALSQERMTAFGDSVHQAFRERPDDVRSRLKPESHPDDVRIAAALLYRSKGEAKLTFAHYLVSQGERSVPAVVEQLADTLGWADRVAAIQVLGKIGSDEASEAVTAQLRDSSDWVRIAAAHALGEIGGETPALVDALGDTADTVVSAALIALGKSGEREGLPAIERLLTHANPRVRAAAVSAFGRLGNSEHAALLEPLLSDPDAGVRYKARQSMDRMAETSGKGAK